MCVFRSLFFIDYQRGIITVYLSSSLKSDLSALDIRKYKASLPFSDTEISLANS